MVVFSFCSIGFFVGCDRDEDNKPSHKLGDVTPWGQGALTQMLGSPNPGDLLIGTTTVSGNNWIILPHGNLGQQLTVGQTSVIVGSNTITTPNLYWK
jgi:hypothetical protein